MISARTAFPLLMSLLLFACPSRAAFLWGVANSAFQVEGSPADSDWWSWEHTPGKAGDLQSAARGTDFFHRYDEDFALAKEMGANAFRLSIPWERIQPAEDRWDEAALDHYEKVLRALRARGLEPVVTLHHYTLPLWLANKGGLLAADFPERFAEYAARMVERFSAKPGEVRWWITFNEPVVLATKSYLMGIYPPGKQDGSLTLRAEAQLIRAHFAAVKRIRGLSVPGLRISIAKNWQNFQPADPSPLSKLAAQMASDFFEHQMLRALTTGKVALHLLGAEPISFTLPLPDGKPALDYLGINNYGRTLIAMKSKPPYYELKDGPGPKTDGGAEVYPEGLYESIRDVARYHLPVLVTENGLPDCQDRDRPEFLEKTFAQLARAKKEGQPVLGYLHWSLTDDFEWDGGDRFCFGLVRVDPQSLAREPRRSYGRYRELIAQYGDLFR